MFERNILRLLMWVIALLLSLASAAFGPVDVLGNCERAAVVFLHGKNENNRDPFNRIAPFTWLAAAHNLCFVLPSATLLDQHTGVAVHMWVCTLCKRT